jgi:hypothetical protein
VITLQIILISLGLTALISSFVWIPWLFWRKEINHKVRLEGLREAGTPDGSEFDLDNISSKRSEG